MKMEKQNKKKQLQKNYTLMNTSKQIHNAKYDMIVLSQLICVAVGEFGHACVVHLSGPPTWQAF